MKRHSNRKQYISQPSIYPLRVYVTHTHKKNDAISTQVGNFYLYIKKKPERYNDDDRNVLSNESYYFFFVLE